MKNSFRRNTVRAAISAALAIGIAGCGGGGSGSGTTDGSVSGLELPGAVEVVSADSGSGSTANIAALKTNFAGAFAAFSDAGTDYSNDGQDVFVWLPALQPIENVNSILCFVDQLRADEMVNKGAYVALVDEGRCSRGDDAGMSQEGGQSSGASNAPSYTTAVVEVTRESNDAPMIVKVWMEGLQGFSGPMNIKARSVVTEGVSDENPFGKFVLTYEMVDPVSGAVIANGELKTVDGTTNGKVGFTHYEATTDDASSAGVGFKAVSSVVMAPDGADGVAHTTYDDVFGSNDMVFAVSFNQNHVAVQEAASVDQLPYKSNNTTPDVCLDRNAYTETVWQYDLYHADTGKRVTVNSGFPIEYDSDGDGNNDSFGYVGYWGVWTEEEGGLKDGSKVYKMDYATGEKTPYTVNVAGGRLIKNTIVSKALTQIEGVDLFYWDVSGEVIVRYLSTSSDTGFSGPGFYKVKTVSWGDTGMSLTDVSPIEKLNFSAGEIVGFYSEALGGSVTYVHDGNDKVTFSKEEFMTGNEPEFQNGTFVLQCLTQCPKGGMTGADLGSSGTPYSDPSSGSTVTYAITADSMTLVRLADPSDPNSGTPVTYPSSGVPQDSMYDWGLRSGPMLTSDAASALQTKMADPTYNAEAALFGEQELANLNGGQAVYYIWETGPNPWNVYTMVKDANGSVVTFDKPIEFEYKHSQANDRSGSAAYDGKTFMVGYGGNGDFWGIPFADVCEDPTSSCYGTGEMRWYAAFGIKDGSLLGPNGDDYVIKARALERQLNKVSGASCSAVLADPAAPLPDGVTGTVDLGDAPVVDAAPAVIGGELQSGS